MTEEDLQNFHARLNWRDEPESMILNRERFRATKKQAKTSAFHNGEVFQHLMPNINVLDGSLEEYSPIAVTGVPLKIEVPNGSHSRAEFLAAAETLYRQQGSMETLDRRGITRLQPVRFSDPEQEERARPVVVDSFRLHCAESADQGPTPAVSADNSIELHIHLKGTPENATYVFPRTDLHGRRRRKG